MTTLRRNRFIINVFLTLLICLWQVAQPLHAATFTWNPTDAGTYSWGTSSFWTPSTGFPFESGDVANITNTITGNQTINLDRVIRLGSLNIGNSGPGTETFTLAGGTGGYLIFDGAGPLTINKSSGGADTISAGIQFNDDLTIGNNAAAANLLTLSGGLRSVLSDLIVTGSGNTTVVTTAIATGGSLVKNGTGLLNLNVGNTYAGATTVNQGTLMVTSTTGVPVRSAVTIASGAILELNNAFTIGSLSGSGLVTNTSGTSRVLTIGRDDTSTTFSGTISPTTTARVAITKIGAGTLTLAPTVASTYTGATVINGGAILLDYTAGSLSSILSSGSTLTLGGGNLALKGRAGATVSQAMGNFTLAASGGAILMDNNGGTSTTLALGTITSTAGGGSLLVRAPANTSVTFNQALNTATTVNGRVVFTDGTGAYNWAANSGVNTATVGLGTYTDVAGTTMAASNTVNSRIDSTVVGETTSVANPSSTTHSLKINAGAAGQSLAIGTNGLVLTSGGLLFTGANDYLISGTTGTLKSNTVTNSDLVIHQYGTGTLTISAAIATGQGTSTLTKAGTGKLVLTGTNTFTGGVFVNGGTLSFSTIANGAGGLGAGVGTAVTIADGATLQYTGASGTIASGTSAGSHTFALTGGQATFEVTNAAATLTFSGAVSGAGGFNKTGSGTLVLAATGTYTGPTNIQEGILQMGGGVNGITSSSPVTIAPAATLDILATAGSQTLTVGSIAGSGTIINSGTSTKTLAVGGNNTSTTFSGTFAAGGAAGNVLTKTGTGTLTLANTTTSAWTGGTNVNGGVLRLAVNNTLSTTGTMVIANAAGPARLELDPGVSQTLAAITITGSSSTATSQGNVVLGLGSVLTLGGTLTISNNNNPQASMITGAGTMALSGTRTFAVNNSTAVPESLPELIVTVPLTSTGGITKSGNGNMLLSGNNSFTGTLTIGGLGTVWMTGDNVAMTGATTLNAGTLVLDYTVQNSAKMGTGVLSLLGGELIMNGNAGDSTSHTVASTTLAAGGSSTVTLNAGSGQEMVLNLGVLTRVVGAGAGTVRFNLPDGVQSATNGITTSTLNNATTGLLGDGSAFATVTGSDGTNFAINSTNTVGGNIVALTSTASDNVSAWAAGLNATDVSGFTGTLASSLSINTLRFNAAGASTVTIANGQTLTLESGGILQTSNVAGISSITGGRLTTGARGDLIFIVDGSQPLDVSSTIAGGDTITKSGKGTLRLSGTNTSSGTITIQDGTIELTGGSAIADTTAISFLNLGGSPTLSLLAGQSETIGMISGGGSSSSANVLLGAGSTLTLNQTAASTYNGLFTVPSTATLVKNGTGTLTYNGNSSVSFAGKLVVNGGAVRLTGSGVGRIGSLDIVLNGGELHNIQDQNSNQDRLANTAVMTLNNTAGTNGLLFDMAHNSGRTDTMGGVTLGAGQNVITMNASGGTSSAGTLTLGNAVPLIRNNNATVLVRGRALGAASGQRAMLTLTTAPAGPVAAIGGAGAAATTTISIFPYMIGQTTAGTPGTTDLGNTFVTNGAAGLRPLSTASGAGAEYIFDQAGYNAMAASSTNNVRFTASASGLTAVSGVRTINALAIDSTSGAVTVSGPAADSLMLTAGALLSTGALANNTALTGYAGITTNTNEYIVFVTNDRFTLGSPLTTTTASLTKASAGTLVLNGLTNSYTGGTYFNEGAIEINALGALGSGNLNFFGGALRWATGSSFDVSTRVVNFGSGGGIFDTNGNNVVLANVFGNNGAGGLIKAGLGSLTLNATPAYTGNTAINGGTLILGLNQAIPNTGLVLGGGTLNLAGFNATVPTLTLSGTDSLITGSGVLTVTGEIIANQGRVDSILSGSANLIKQTAGQTVVLTNPQNSYTGFTHIQNGSLSIPSVPAAGVPGYLGNQTGDNAIIRLGQGTTTGMLVVTGAGGSIDRDFDLVGTTGGGGIDNDGTAAIIVNGDITSTTAGVKSLVLAGDSTGFVNILAGSFSSNTATLGITKNEAGTWTLPGNYTYAGNTVVNGGVLNITGSITGNTTSSTLAYGGTAGNAVVNVSGDMTLFSTTGGNAVGAVGVYNQTAGNVIVTPGTGNSQYVARAAGSYGYFNLTGGTYKNSNRWDTNAASSLGNALNTATSSIGVVYVGGTGFLDHTNAEWFINGYSLGQITVAGNGAIDHTGSNNPFAIFMDSSTTGGTYGVLNVAGGSVTIGTQPIRFGNSTTNGSGNTGFVNLAGGTLSVGAAMNSSVNASGANNAYLAFSGGTLKFTGSVSNWIPASTAGITYTPTLFGAIDNSSVSGAPSFSGGLTVDTNGFNTTLNDSTSVLKGATGSGVTQANLQVTGGSGYVGAPAVVFSTAGVLPGGTPAAGYALISNGAVTGIVITNPGTYAAGTVPTVTLSGGGGTGASVTALPLNTANVSGGLVKTGNGTLTLTGSHTYGGATTINGGALSVGGNALPNTSSLRVGETGSASFNLYQDGVGSTMTLALNADIILGGTSSGGTLGFQLGTTSDRIQLNGGDLIVNTGGGYIDATAITGFGLGSYQIITGAASITGALQLGSLPGGYMYGLTNDGSNVTLQVLSTAASGDIFWTGDVNNSWATLAGGNTNWSLAANGSADAGFTPGATNVVHFSASSVLASPITMTLDNSYSIQGLKFLPSSATGVSIAPGNLGSLSLGVDGIEMQAGAPASVAISAPVTLAANQTWTVEDATSSLAVSGVVSGAGNLTIKGGGTVVLSGVNTFTGNVTMDGVGSTLSVAVSQLNNADANSPMGAAGAHIYTMLNGGVFSLSSAHTLNPTSGSGKSFVYGLGGGTMDVVSPTGIVQLDDANQFYLQGGITLKKTGAGTLLLGGTTDANVGVGVTVAVEGGTLRLQAAGSLGTSNKAAIILGGGTTLDIRVNSGTTLGNNVTLIGDATISTGRTTASSANITQVMGTLTVGNNTLTQSNGNGNTAPGVANLTFGATTLVGTPTFNVTNVNGAGIGTLTLGPVSDGGAGYGINKSGNGILLLSSDNSYTGATNVLAGTLQFARLASLYANDQSQWTTANIVVESGATLGVNVGGTGEFTADDVDTLLALGSATGGFKNGAAIALDTSNAPDGHFIFDSNITNTNGGANVLGLTKAGAGTLTLTGTQSYTGPTTITGGALAGNIGAGNLVFNGGVYESNGTFNLPLGTGNGQVRWVAGGSGGFSARGGDLTVMLRDLSTSLIWGNTASFVSGSGQLLFGSTTADSTVFFPHGINLNGAVRTIQVLDNTASTTDKAVLSGVLSGAAGGINKTGAGVLELAGTNTYTGTTTLTLGTLQLNNANNGGLGSGQLILTAGTLQALRAGITLTNDTQLTAVSISGDHSLTFSGTMTGVTGGSRTLTSSINGGTLTLANIGINADTASARTLTLAGTGNTVINGVISNGNASTASNLSITNTALTTINGANTYTGNTTVNAGVGSVVVNGKISGGNLTVNSGSLTLNTSSDQTVGLLTMGGGAAGSEANLTITSGRKLTVTGVTFSGTNNNMTSVIDGAGTLDLGTAGITINIANSTSVDVDMSWEMATVMGSGLLTKDGAGTLDIRGVTNYNYAATGYQINAGAILGLNLVSSNLILNGGVYEGSGSFTRALGTGNNQVQWLSGGGGFSARGGDLTVTLAGAPTTLVWGGTTNFVPNAAPLIFGSTTADSLVTFTHNIDLNGAIRTVQVNDNAAVTSDIAILGGILSNGSLTKTGTGTLRLNGANTFTGSITITQGILEFSTASNNGGLASNLGQGTDGLSLGGGSLSFVGDTVNQSTNRAISVTAASTLLANGTNNAAITYAGAITTTANVGLTLGGTGKGTISGGLTITPPSSGTPAADLTVAGGSWTLSGPNSSIADDILLNSGTLTLENTVVTVNDDTVVSGVNSILNLNSTGVWNALNTAGTSSGLYARGGGQINLNAHDINGAANVNGLDFILLADGTTTGTGTLNTNTFNITTPRLDLGSTADGYEGKVIGSGTVNVTYTGNDWASGIRLFRGSVEAKLAGVASILKQGLGDATLKGDNSGLTATVGTRIDSGNLILDYSANNSSKISTSAPLDMRGGTLILDGGILDDTLQNVASFTLAGGGSSQINVNGTVDFKTTLSLGAITRANGAGTIRFVPGTGGVLMTTTANNGTTGMLGSTGTAFATINDGTGTYFAINDGSGKIVALTYLAAKNDPATWLAGDHVTSSGTGFTTSSVNVASINSLRFDAPVASTITIDPLGVLTIASGGILQTDNVTGGPSVISGGRLVSGTGDLVITTDSPDSLFRISSYMSGTTILTKSGAGTLLLDSINHSSGATNIQNGTVRIAGGNAIGDRSVVTLADDHTSILELLDSETIGSLSGGSATTGLSHLALVSVGSNTLTINQISNTTYSGVISGDGTIVKTGTGTLTLGGVNTFTGDLILNQGQLTLSSRTIANFTNVRSVTLNAATMLLDFAGGTEGSPNKINNNAPVTMINTGGIDGLRANNDRNDASKAETIGTLTFLGGANTITASASSTSGTTQRSMTITAGSLVRSNRATLLVRGQNLGTTSTTPGDPIHTGRIVVSAPPALAGGIGAAGTTSISILPWAIGSTSITGTGNSFVTHVGTTGFRPLDVTSEYEQLNPSGGVIHTNNVRYSGSSDLTLDGATPRTLNALLLENTSTTAGITVAGAGATLGVNSGAFLILGSQPVTISGFSSITTGSLNEYIFHVSNTAAAGVTISSPFTTTAAGLTKSGAGTLVLASAGSTYTGPTTVNQGVLQIDSLNKLGNLGSGGLYFNAGTLKFGAAFDVSAIPVTFGVSATSTVETTVGGTFDTNGFNVTLSNSIGGGGNGGFTKIGAGNLTLNAVARYAGATTLSAGTLIYGVANALPTTTDLTMAASTTLTLNSNAAELRGLTLTGSAAIGGGAALTFTGNVVNSGGDRTLSLTNTATTTFNGDYIYLSESGTARTFTLSSTGSVVINSDIVDGGAAASAFAKTGAGTLELKGANVYSGTTTNSTGTLIMSGTNTGTGNTTLTSGTLQLNNAANGGLASGLLTLTSGTVQALNAARTLSNNTVIGGSVTVTGSQSLTVNGSFTNSGGNRALTNNLTSGSQFTLAGPVYLSEATGTGRTLTVTGTGRTVVSGVISNFNGSGTAGLLTKTGTGVLILSGANTYSGATTLTTGTLLVNNTSGSAIGSGNITGAAGTTFGGTGSISGTLTTTGVISPGSWDAADVSMIGQLTVGTLTANTGSSLFMQIGGNTLSDPNSVTAYLNSPGTFTVPASWTTTYDSDVTQHDQLYVSGSGAPTLTSTITVSGTYLNGYTPAYGAIFQVVDWASLGTNNIGGTQTFNLPSLTNGLSWNTDFFKSHGVLMVVGVVPEPSRMLLLLMALLMLGYRRRRA